MVSKLKAIDPKQAEPSKPKILIFGREGVGKTWTSMDFPSVYYIDTEGGGNRDHYTDKLKKSGGMYFGPDQGSQSFEEVTGQVKALATEKHSFKTVVLDSASKLMAIEVGTETDRLMDDGKKIEYGVEKKPAARHARRINGWIDKIDMNVIIISHQKAEYAKGEQVGVTYDAWDKIGYDLDLVLNIVKEGNSRKARVVKSRLLEFPEGTSFNWSYEEFSNRYGREVIERAATQIELASPDQIKELVGLLAIVKLPDGQEEKWLKTKKVESWEDMDSASITGAIAHIRKTYLAPSTKE